MGLTGLRPAFIPEPAQRAAHTGRMNVHRRYNRISIGFAVVWAIILLLGAIIDRNVEFSGTTFEVLLVVFGGFVIGWVMATMARDSDGSTAPS